LQKGPLTLPVAGKPGKDFRWKRGVNPGEWFDNGRRAVVACEAYRALVMGSAVKIVVMNGENESGGKQHGQAQHPKKLLSRNFL
jgi:hypothetical protein